MINSVLILLCIMSQLYTSICGRVNRFGARYVTMSNVNPGSWSEYNFTMTFDTELPANGQIEITFPKSDYPDLLGLGTNYKIYAPYPNDVTATSTLSGVTVIVKPGVWPAGKPLTVTIPGIKNSAKSGGTGNFAIITKIGNYILDQNRNFAVLGLAQQTEKMIDADIEIEAGYSQNSGELTNYIFTMNPSQDLPANIEFKITFPLLYDLSQISKSQCEKVVNSEGWQISGSVFCRIHDDFKNIMYIMGNNGTISKGQLMVFRLKEIFNPQRQMTTPLFIYQINELQTNNTLQESNSVKGLDILSGKMKLVRMFTKYPGYIPYAGYIRTFVLQFRPKNPFIAAIITTNFYEVLSCSITRGLLDIDANSDSQCSPSYRVMYLTNFADYQESDFPTDYIEVQFTARISYSVYQTNPVEIYTYADADLRLIVDSDLVSASTCVDVQPLPNHITSASIQSSIFTIGSSVTLTFTLELGAAYTYSNLILIELPNLYTGIPICQFKGNGQTTFTDYACSLASALLTFNLGNQNVLLSNGCGVSCPILRVTNIYNPSYGGVYSIRVLVFGNGAIFPTNEFNTTLSIGIPTFSSTTVTPISNNAGDMTALHIAATIVDNLPAGVKTLPDPFVSYSYIEVLFKQFNTGQPLFSMDLGTGLNDLDDPGCAFEYGLVAAFNQNLNCIIKLGSPTPSLTDYVVVQIKNYASIVPGSGGTLVSFDIPLIYPTTVGVVPQVILRLSRYDRKILTVVREQTYFLSSSKVISGSPLPLINLNGPLLDTLTIQSDSTLTYYMKTVFNIPASGANCLYYQIPIGFTFDFSKVQLSIDDVYLSPASIHYFPVFGFILVSFENNFSNGKLHKIQFEKVDLPKSLSPVPISHFIKTTLNAQFADAATFTIPSLAIGTLFDVSSTTSQTSQGHLFSNYSIQFTTTLKTTDDATITVDFPVDYNFDTPYDPILDNIPYCGLFNKSDTQRISTSFAGQRATISNFANLIKGQQINLGLFSITNPSTEGTYSLIISIRSQDGNVIEQSSVDVLISADVFAAYTFDITSISSLPNNAISQAIYFFRFTPLYDIPRGSVINIQFPASYTSLHTFEITDVYCQANIDSEVVGLRKCEIIEISRQVEIETNAHFFAGKPVELQYYGLLIQNSPGPVAGIAFRIIYKGFDIAISAIVPTLDIASVLQPITETSLDFYPQNEGEIAYYVFKMPLSNFDILSTYQILIRFPQQYDFTPGISKLQITSSSLDGALRYWTLPRHIFITGFYEYLLFTGDLEIKIFGIINPQRFNNDITESFSFGILDINGYTLLTGSESIEGIIPQLAPEGIQLNSISSLTYNCRYTSTFTFDFYPLQAILPSANGGQIYVDFPQEFVIDYHSGSCESTRAFSFFSSCQQDYFRFLLISNNPEWVSILNGALKVQINEVRTPDEAGETGNFIIYNYDQLNKIVLGRTYSNLHLASLTFVYDGAQITVNDGLPYNLEVGSYSDPIRISLDGPSTQPLTLSPNVVDSRILISPNPVQIEIGQRETFFQLAAPRNILLKPFYIVWSKTGDSLPITYAPVRKTKIQMVKGTLLREVQVELMEYLPINGTSYPLYLTTKNPPYQELILRTSFYSDMRQHKMMIPDTTLTQLSLTSYYEIYTSTQLTTSFANISQANLSSNALFLHKLMSQVNYSVNTSDVYADPKITIFYSLAGFDCQSYRLQRWKQVIPIRPQEFRKPKILQSAILEVNRATATFQIFGDTKGFIYYVVGDQHMEDPTFEDTKFPDLNNPTFIHSNPKYGICYIRSSELDVNFTLTDLQAYHDYDLFIFIQNLNGVFNPKFSKLYFKTQRSQFIATFTMKIFQAQLAPELKLDFFSRISQMINVQKSRLLERTTECAQTIIDESPISSQYYWNLVILPDPTNMNPLTAPIVLAQNLNIRRAEIRNFLTRLDTDPFVSIKEINPEIPNFVISPEMIERTISSIAFRFSMSNCGFAYLTFYERSESTSSTIVNETNFAQEFPEIQFPSAYQLKKGLDIKNQPVNWTSFQVMDTNTILAFNYTDLKEKTVYDVYFALENQYTINPELFDNLSVARFSAKTLKKKIPLNVYSEFSSAAIQNAVIALLIVFSVIL